MKAEKVIERTDNRQVHNLFRQALERISLVLLEHVIGDLVGRIQLATVDAFQRLQIGFGGFAFIGEIGIADEITKTVGIAHVAPEHGVQRIALQACLIIGGK